MHEFLSVETGGAESFGHLLSWEGGEVVSWGACEGHCSVLGLALLMGHSHCNQRMFRRDDLGEGSDSKRIIFREQESETQDLLGKADAPTLKPFEEG